MKKKTWKVIPDNQVFHHWKCKNRHCMKKESCFVLPTFYQEAGTPVCDGCGNDMTYIETKVKI